MSIYSTIYNNLCNKKRQLKECWKPGSNLHRHHIVPRHSNGKDTEENFTYLTIREHIIAHYLLWKIYKNPNDLRAMHMLGARLTSVQRRVVGLFCKENKVGFWGASIDQQSEWKLRGVTTQIKTKIGIHNPETRSEYASLGGKIGGVAQMETKIGIYNPENRSEYASLGAKSHIGKKWIHNGNQCTRVTKDKIDHYLSLGWKLGTGKSGLNKYSNQH